MTTAQRHTAIWLAGFAAFLALLWLLSAILLPFVAGFAIAYFLNPLVNRIERLGVPRGVASLSLLLSFLLVVVIILLLLVPVFETQILDLISRLPALLTEARRELDWVMRMAEERLAPEDVQKFRDLVSARLNDVVAWFGSLARAALTRGFAFANMLSLAFVMPVVSFFLLRDWNRLLARIDGWLPRAEAPVIRQQARLIDETLGAFVRGQTTVCLVLGGYFAVMLSLIGLDFGLILGLLIGLLTFIPYVGGSVGFSLAMILALTQFADWRHVVYVVLVFVVGWAAEGNFLTPRLVGARVKLHPVWVIFALLAFGSVFGVMGVLIAVPVAAVVGVLVRFALGRYLASDFYDPAAARPLVSGVAGEAGEAGGDE